MPVFLFTDIEGSTRLWEQHTAEMGAVIARHDALLRERVHAAGGRITKHTGDGITAAFEAGEPLACALQAQRCFALEDWGIIGELRIRVGLHAGPAEWIAGIEGEGGDYFGPPVNCAARIMSAAWGGQILLTPEVSSVSHLPARATLEDLGQHLLKNVGNPQQIYQLVHPDLPRQAFPPPRTLSGQSIREAVDRQGAQMAHLASSEMAVALVSATLLPAVLGDLPPDSPALAGNVGVLQDLGAAALAEFLGGFAARLQAAEPEEIRRDLEAALGRRWAADAVLRADASRLLQAVQGVDMTLAAATGEVREALARGLAGLGSQFDEFRWVLGDVQETLAEVRGLQRMQLDLQQLQLARTEELLALHKAQARLSLPGAPEALEVEPHWPAFLEEGAPDLSHRPVFVARDRELGWLGGKLDAALAGEGGVVFVAGGPGRGKTALLDAFARQAMGAHDGLLVASGACNAYSGLGDPYLPFREVLGMLSGEVEAHWAAGAISRDHALRLWQALPAAVEALLAHGPHVVPALVPGEALLARAAAAGAGEPWLPRLRAAVARGSGAAGGLEQSHLFQQVSNVLQALSQVHPLLLIVDDLQWVDRASAGLLFHVGRRLAGACILIAGAYRPEEMAPDLDALGAREGARHRLEKVLAEFKRRYGDVWLDLAEVDAPEGRQLVDGLLDTEPNRLGEQFRQTLVGRAEGHPLFTVELLRAMQERGDLVQDEAGRWVEGPALDWDLLPARVEGVIAERIERLGADLRQILTVASVEGEDFTAEVVAQVQSLEARALVRRLSGELQREHRLVRARGLQRLGPRRLALYRFQHHLFQKYLYNHLDQAERAYLHEDVGTVLEALYGDQVDEVAVQLARHFVEAGVTDKAAHYLGRAGVRALAAYANVEAEGHYRAALELVEREAGRADLLGELGRALDRQTRYEEALEVWQEGITRYQALGNQDGVARLYARSARAASSMYQRPRELALCREGMAAVAGAPESPDQADLLHETARACILNGLPDEAATLRRRALEMAERVGAVRVQAEALTTLASRHSIPYEESLSLFGQAIELAESAGLLDQAARAHNNLGVWLIDLQASREHFWRAAELQRQRGDIGGERHNLFNVALWSCELGDLAEVEEIIQSWQEFLDGAEGPVPLVAAAVHWLEVWLWRYQGELAQAIEGFQSLRAEEREDGHLEAVAVLCYRIAEICIWEEVGEEEQIDAALQEALDLGERGLGAARRVRCLLSVQRARQGELEAACHLLAEVHKEAAEQGRLVMREPDLSWAEAKLAMAAGRWAEALAAFEATADMLGRRNERWRRARTLVDWAGAHLARAETGDRERAEDLLREAEAEFEAMGAHGYVARVQARLGELYLAG
jgi:class 3 adenylate cyclase/tetratricopeptide (TPR) repeat protein